MTVKLQREENSVSFYVPSGKGYAVAAALLAKGWDGTSTPWNPQDDLLRFKLGVTDGVDDGTAAQRFARDLDAAFPDMDFEVDVGWS